MPNDSAVKRKNKQIAHRLHPPLNDVEASAFLGVAVQTLRNWRHTGKGPVYYKLSEGPRGPIRYDVPDLRAYKHRCRIDPEAA
jgi:hypothetical protein